MIIICAQCNKSHVTSRTNAKFCSENCRVLYHYHHSTKVKNIKNTKQIQNFSYVNTARQAIRKPMSDHVYHPQNILKMDDRTNYYRGNGIFGYDDHEAIGIEDESSIE